MVGALPRASPERCVASLHFIEIFEEFKEIALQAGDVCPQRLEEAAGEFPVAGGVGGGRGVHAWEGTERSRGSLRVVLDDKGNRQEPERPCVA